MPNPILSAITGLGTVLDTPRAVLLASLVGTNPLSAIIKPSERIYGRDITGNWLTGMLLDALMDPVNLGAAAGLLSLPERRAAYMMKYRVASNAAQAANLRMDRYFRDSAEFIRRADALRDAQIANEAARTANVLKDARIAHRTAAIARLFPGISLEDARAITIGPTDVAADAVARQLGATIVPTRRLLATLRPNVYEFEARYPPYGGLVISSRPDFALIRRKTPPGKGIPRPEAALSAHEGIHQFEFSAGERFRKLHELLKDQAINEGARLYSQRMSPGDAYAFLSGPSENIVTEAIAELAGSAIERNPLLALKLMRAASKAHGNWYYRPEPELVGLMAESLGKHFPVQAESAVPAAEIMLDAILGTAYRRNALVPVGRPYTPYRMEPLPMGPMPRPPAGWVEPPAYRPPRTWPLLAVLSAQNVLAPAGRYPHG